MPLYFITSSKRKLAEAQAILPQLQQLEMDLPEIQEMDAHKIIEAKLQEARTRYSGRFIVEDSSLYIDALGGLPGPLVKWFLQTVGPEGLYTMTKAIGNTTAQARAIIGYANENGGIEFFEGETQGKVVPPRGPEGFGWDPIFLPDEAPKTFAEMTPEEKNTISHRRRALDKLKLYLESNPAK